MKRLFLIVVLVMIVYWSMGGRHPGRHGRVVAPPPPWDRGAPRPTKDGEPKDRFTASTAGDAKQALADARRAIEVARQEARHAIDEARHEVRQALDEARHEVRQALSRGDSEARSELHSTHELADGIPVPIVAGTRVTVAEALPPPPRPPAPPAGPARVAAVAPPQPAPCVVVGQLSATEERAKADARSALNRRVAEWLAADVPGSWSTPSSFIDALILESRLKPIVKDYGVVYEAELTADLSPERRAAIIEVYHGEQVRHRLTALGGVLSFVLICLASISGYIRTDEATKGYYTNRLRILTAAGVGAAGVVLYQMFA